MVRARVPRAMAACALALSLATMPGCLARPATKTNDDGAAREVLNLSLIHISEPTRH